MNSAPLTTNPSTAAASAPGSLNDGDTPDTYSRLLEERMRDVAQEATAHAMANSSAPGVVDAFKNGVPLSASAQSDQGNMAELLEAAAKATSRATSESQRWSNATGHGLRKVAGHQNLRGSAMEEDGHDGAGLKRKRTPDGTRDEHEDMGGDEYSTGAPSPSKRTKVAPFAESQTQTHTTAAQFSRSADVPSPQHSVAAQSNPMQSLEMTDVRAAVGVHSAAALFRQTPTDSRKKYTRPPMHKLFSDLQLTPENFVRLQACAKTYMLDDGHPERQECVGNRGKGDADMVKLRLFNCARDFLNGGVGERFFGPYVPTPTEYDTIDGKPVAPDRKWIWPRDANKIVSLVTPLLRRMVTNERQRQYAQETRKGGSKKQDTAPRDGSQESSSERAALGMASLPSQPSLDHSVHSHDQRSPHAQSSPRQSLLSPQKQTQQLPHESYPQFVQAQHAQSREPHSALIQPTMYGAPSCRQMSPTMARQPLSPRARSSPQPSPRLTSITPPAQQQRAPTTPATPVPSTAPAAPIPLPPTTTTTYPPPRPSENVIQILITKNNTKLAPRIDLPSFPSTPHHTMPLTQLRGIVGEEVKALVRGGVVPGLEGEAGNVRSTVARMEVEAAEEPARGKAGAGPGAGGQNREEHADDRGSGTAAQQAHGNSDNDLSSSAAADSSTLPALKSAPPVLLPPRYELRALTGRGLLLVETERDWQGVLAEVATAAWMEGAVRVVAEVLPV